MNFINLNGFFIRKVIMSIQTPSNTNRSRRAFLYAAASHLILSALAVSQDLRENFEQESVWALRARNGGTAFLTDGSKEGNHALVLATNPVEGSAVDLEQPVESLSNWKLVFYLKDLTKARDGAWLAGTVAARKPATRDFKKAYIANIGNGECFGAYSMYTGHLEHAGLGRTNAGEFHRYELKCQGPGFHYTVDDNEHASLAGNLESAYIFFQVHRGAKVVIDDITFARIL